MNALDRRSFIQVFSGALFSAAAIKLLANSDKPILVDAKASLTVKALNYSWEYTKFDDTFRLLDSSNRLIVSGKMQPAIVVAPSGDSSHRLCTPGKSVRQQIDSGRVIIDYENVNGTARVSAARSVHWNSSQSIMFQLTTPPTRHASHLAQAGHLAASHSRPLPSCRRNSS